MKMTHEEIADALDVAAAAVEAKRWPEDMVDGWMVDGTTALCLEGGIQAATGIDSIEEELVRCPVYQAVNRYLLDRHELVYPSRLYLWNDRKGRTQQEVIDLLRTVAKHERGLAEGLDL